MKPSRSTGTLVFRIIFGVSVLLLLIKHVDLTVLLTLSTTQAAGVGLIIICLLGTTWLEAARLYSLGQGQFAFRESLRIAFVSHFLTNLLPSTIGGDGYKVVKLADNSTYIRAAALIIVERVLGLLVLLLGSVLLVYITADSWAQDYYNAGSRMFSNTNWSNYVVPALAGLTLALGLTLLFMRKAIGRLAREFIDAISEVPFRTLAYVLIWTLLFHTARTVILCVLLESVGFTISFAQCWAVLTFAAIVTLLPLSIGGLGIRESAFVVALQPFSVLSSWALFAALVFRVGSIGQAVVGAILFLRNRQADSFNSPQ